MNLYLDDDIVDKDLIKLLESDGHDVQIPPTSGKRKSVLDTDHMANAIQSGRIMLTKNHADYLSIVRLLKSAGGIHPGILIIREDGDSRDMKPRQVAQVIAKIASDAERYSNQAVVLNAWR